MLDEIVSALGAWGDRVYLVGGVPNKGPLPYLLVYSMQPVPIRSMARPEGARRFRFGVTVVDLGAEHIEADADRVEAILEGSRALGASSRIELVSRGPALREPEVTSDGQEYVSLPLHFTTTIPRGTA